MVIPSLLPPQYPLTLKGDRYVVPTLKDKGTLDRRSDLYGAAGARFFPAGKQELNEAYRLWLRSVTKGEVANHDLERIEARLRATSRDGQGVERGERAVMSKVRNYGTFARRALADQRGLQHAGKAVSDAQQLGETYDSLADFFNQRSTPYHEGPGQLVRFLDLKRAVEDQSFDHAHFALSARFHKLTIGGWTLVDPYTMSQPSQEMAEHAGEVLSSLSFDDALSPMSEVLFNEQSRLGFWQEKLREVRSDNLVQPIADTALRATGANPHEIY